MSSPKTTVCLLIVCLTCIVSTAGRSVTITPGRGTTANISSTDANCMCLEGRSSKCERSFVFKDNTPGTVILKCPTSKFMVEFSRSIDCDTKRCSGNIVHPDPDSDARPLLDLNRKFTWNLKASAPKAFKIEFTKTGGLRQINPSERCPDGHSYTLQAFQTTGKTAVGKYCTSGPISSVQILNMGSFSLEVPAGKEIQNGRFDVSVGEEIKSLAKMTLTLPKGISSSELLTPNYPESFPDDDVMEWYFQVPTNHKTDIKFLNLTQPSCRKKETAVEYHSKGRSAVVLGLNEKQPSPDWGDFTMTLRNCEMDRGRTGSPGLSLGMKVSTSRTSSTVLCKVDLTQKGGLSLSVEKLRPASDCQMKENSVSKEKITVTSTSDLFFQDCLPEDVRVTASRVIGCKQLKDCPKTPVRLSLPALPSCLPFPLSSITWTLRPPQHGTVELTSPSGPLKQDLPGQPCNDSMAIKVAEDDGTSIGDFCPDGAIQKIQIHTNMSVTLSSMGGRALKTCYKNVLDACFKEEITERYIFTVSPKEDTSVLLATPGWPKGMGPYATVSWIVSVPPQMDAHLMFHKLSQPKCGAGHTNIRVQRVGFDEEDYSRREDEDAESELIVSKSFYLNMSNCMPESGDFSVITKITLQQSRRLLLTVILSVLAALLVIFAIVLAVVCVVIRKKKKKLNPQVSIYNPNGTVFLPGKSYFPKTREDNESHVYTTIEETLVYTHLLKKGMEIGVYGETDVQHPFTGHTDSQKPLVSKDSGAEGAEDAETGVYQPFRYPSQQGPPLPARPPSLPLVDNEIYQTEGQSEEEHSPNLGLRLEPEGGD